MDNRHLKDILVDTRKHMDNRRLKDILVDTRKHMDNRHLKDILVDTRPFDRKTLGLGITERCPVKM